MQFLIIVLIISFVIYLFALHVLAKEDLVFVRKNITLETLFNLSFYSAGLGLLFSRLVYVALNPSPDYFNPLVLLLFPYFPGLSLSGGIIGGIIFIFLYNRRKRVPVGRILDFFSLSFLTALPFGLLGTQLLLGMQDPFQGILLPVIFLASVFFSVKVLLPLNVRGEIKDGTLAGLIMTILSITLLISSVTHVPFQLSFKSQLDNSLLLVLLIASLVSLVRLERKGQLVKRHYM